MRVLAMATVGLWFGSLGCAQAVHPGLANAPSLGGTRIADPRVHDVIANGQDSCGRRLEPNSGPLRYRVPPCAPGEVSAAGTTLVPPSAGDDSLGIRWMDHYYIGWPCKARQETLAGGAALAWSPVFSAGGVCGLR